MQSGYLLPDHVQFCEANGYVVFSFKELDIVRRGRSTRWIRQKLRAYNRYREEWHVTMREEYDGFMETVSSGDPSRSRLLNTDQLLNERRPVRSFRIHRLSPFPSRVALDAIFERLAQDHALFLWDDDDDPFPRDHDLVGKWNVIEKNGWLDVLNLIFVMDGYPRLGVRWRAEQHVWSQHYLWRDEWI